MARPASEVTEHYGLQGSPEHPLETTLNLSLHDELELLVSAGLPPMAAIQSATINAADSLGAKDSYGAVAAGRVASLVLIDGNPLTDIRNVRQIRFVVLRGHLFDRTALANLAK